MRKNILIIISWLKRGKQRIVVLKYLSKYDLIFPNELKKRINNNEKEFNFSLSEISRHLLSFKEKNLSECLDEDLPWGRSYRITNLGKEILKEIEKLEE